jgi:hypothetical protein
VLRGAVLGVMLVAAGYGLGRWQAVIEAKPAAPAVAQRR